MLVFRRQQGESFRIGENVEVRILQLSHSYVKIGVIAPRDIEILRTELSALNREAASHDWSDPEVKRRFAEVLAGLRSPNPSGPNDESEQR